MCKAGEEIGQVSFNKGEAGADSTEKEFNPNCAFNGVCGEKRILEYWKSAKMSKDVHLWYKFDEPRIIVAFNFQVVEDFAPIQGMKYIFYGTNSSDCVKQQTELHRPTTKREYFVEIDNKKSFTCYGFKIKKVGKDVKHAAIRPPVKVKFV